MNMTNNNLCTTEQRRATRALIQYCRSHQAPTGWIERLEEILRALETSDASEVKRIYPIFNGGGMGSFLDWFPKAINENEEYKEDMLWALRTYWDEVMKPFEEK